MLVKFNEKNREFHLSNDSISYIMKVLDNGHIGQLYFGKKVRHRNNFENMYQIWSGRVDMSTMVFDDNENFSLDVTLQEYPSYGTSDFRQPAVQILQENGSRITVFSLQTIRYTKGKLSWMDCLQLM